MRQVYITAVGLLSALSVLAPLGVAQRPGHMMDGQRYQMMQGQKECPAMGEHYGAMMQAEDVDIKLENLRDGVKLTMTTTDRAKVKRLQAMAQHMKSMHSKTKGEASNGTKGQGKPSQK